MARSMTARAVRWSTPSAPNHREMRSVGGPLSRTACPARSRCDLPATREDRGELGVGVISDTGQLSQRGGAGPNAPWHDVVVSEEQHKAEHRGRPSNDEFRDFVATGWAPRCTDKPDLAAAAPFAALRRAAVSAAFPGERLVIPAGGLKVRSNDCDYMFRPHSAFAHLSGLGSDREPDAVLVLEPGEDGSHESILYLRPLAERDTEEFFGASRCGAL